MAAVAVAGLFGVATLIWSDCLTFSWIDLGFEATVDALIILNQIMI
jgi:hypothetical protein